MEVATEKEVTTKSELTTNPEVKNGDVSRILKNLKAIGELDVDDFLTNYNISRTTATLTDLEKSYGKSLKTMAMKWCVKDKNGSPNILSNGSFEFATVEDMNNFLNEKASLDDSMIPSSAKIYPVKMSKLKNVRGIKPNMISGANEVIIHDLTEADLAK